MCRSADTDTAQHVRAQVCQHGTIHVTVGPTTLHLLPSEAALLFCSVAEIARRWPILREAVDEVAHQYAKAHTNTPDRTEPIRIT
ncbi:MAG: hypothetical protein AAF561_13565 [Planctomycetota bacterium]